MVALSKENLYSLKKELSSFSQTFSDRQFKTVYDTKYSLDSEVLEYANVDALKNLDSVIDELGVNFEQIRSDDAGIVSYSIDGLEELTSAQVTADLFEKSGYTKNMIKSGQLIEQGAPAYKLVTSSDWSIVFPITEEERTLYQDKSSLSVKFTGTDLNTSAKYSAFTGADGAAYGQLSFTKYMEQFVSNVLSILKLLQRK